jgi:sugar O-acyltransferase (sialic acid O-acetyltransferase NeuD family)
VSKPLLIIGSGGHASVLVDILRQQNREILGVISPDKHIRRKVFEHLHHFTCDEDVLKFDKKEVRLVNGIGSLPRQLLRSHIFQRFSDLGYKFETVVASSAIVSKYAELYEGAQVMAGAIIQTGAVIGVNSIINTGAIVEHDCNIGSYNHIAPGVTLSGQVQTEDNVHIGTGASVIHLIIIGKNSVIGAGSTITKNVADNIVCFPARITQKVIKQHEP